MLVETQRSRVVVSGQVVSGWVANVASWYWAWREIVSDYGAHSVPISVVGYVAQTALERQSRQRIGWSCILLHVGD
ncbi:hypothetical protein Scep_010319 [Stephania cephalantha]|uniref:Uncharacterized protein n=1 Tax=Stephania cephalantha TaxID=152367 RepID=A0AAP0JUT5_9MAGN